jgi:lipopolysaccharide assembly outer membrane protein LptD (OstA)
MEGYLHGDQVKVIDSNTMYIKNARYTTCDLDDPHFYVEIGKAKVIKDKIIVGKPADVVIAGVRTPLFLPFAMLPSMKSKGTGLLMPTYGQSTELGFFLK